MADADGALVVQFQIVDMAQASAQLTSFANQLNALPSKVTSGAARMFSPAVEQTQKIVSNLNKATGPMQKLMAAQLALRSANASGDPSRIFDARDAVRLAQGRVTSAQNIANGYPASGMKMLKFTLPPKQPAPPPTFVQAMKNAIFSTRFTANNGQLHLMPLIGRTMQALASLGPIGIAAGAAAAGIMALHAAAAHAAAVLSELAAARYTGGGSYGETSRAAGLGAAFGGSAGDVAAMARELANNLATNPTAMATGAKYHISDPGGDNPLSGSVDKFPAFFKAAEVILNAPTDEEAIRAARGFGGNMEKLLSLRDLSPASKAQALNMMQDMFGPEQARAVAEYKFATGKLSLAFDKLLISMTPVINMFTMIVTAIPEAIRMALNAAIPGANIGDRMMGGGANSASDKMKKSTDANTDAIDGLNSTLKGVSGGGSRARSAVPGGVGGTFYMGGNMGGAARMGAFSWS